MLWRVPLVGGSYRGLPFLPLSSFPVLGPARLPRRRAQAFTIILSVTHVYRDMTLLYNSWWPHGKKRNSTLTIF